MTKKARAQQIVTELKTLYTDAQCTLDYKTPWQLLFNTRLAAQCTDARVNQVAGPLYEALPTLDAFAHADEKLIEDYVRPCGFYHTKARDLKSCAQILLDDYRGRVPDTMEELLKLPGIGRKTASLVLGEVYGKPALVTDTHCIRLSNRLGLAESKDPYKVELALAKLIPEPEQLYFCHRLVHHGRAVCTARSPRCGECALAPLCPSAKP
ncbi:MAG: endonuclease III [Oscillospiraceae bacterium]|jgi:endonuclease-3|nr:endonuclease III [Oscillospiraceae bacterium]